MNLSFVHLAASSLGAACVPDMKCGPILPLLRFSPSTPVKLAVAKVAAKVAAKLAAVTDLNPARALNVVILIIGNHPILFLFCIILLGSYTLWLPT